jgi:anthranilate phosphoribosyltransferase
MIDISDILRMLRDRRELNDADLHQVITAMMAGRCLEADAAAFLLALREKGETAREIACAARVMRQHMLPWDAGLGDLLDTCGTGGDGSGTFNISTATALVIAAAGTRVVKHGNRSVSSRTGSADVLAALGVKIDGDKDFVRRCLGETGFAFCFAPQFHPAMRHVAPIRKALGVPTIFNLLGPLANPAGASRQLLGVGRPEFLDRMADALAELGTNRSFVLCSQDGLDEVSLSAPTSVCEVLGHDVERHEWTAADFGLEPCTLAELAAHDAAASAATILDVFSAKGGPAERIVLANAAAGLLLAERVTSLADGVAQAREAIRSGAAMRVLERLRELSK